MVELARADVERDGVGVLHVAILRLLPLREKVAKRRIGSASASGKPRRLPPNLPQVERGDVVPSFHHAAASSKPVIAMCGRRSPAALDARILVAVAQECAKRRCSFRYSTTGVGRRILRTCVTQPLSASKIGKRPVSMARRASLIVSCEAAPQPSGQGTLIWM